MKTFKKILKWMVLLLISTLILVVVYIRFTRKVDLIIYQADHFKPYEKFESIYKVQEQFIAMDDKGEVKLHAALFKPDSMEAIATIFHPMGKGGNMLNVQKFYKALIKNGFQVFTYEYRNIGLSSGKSDNSLVLKSDALKVFDFMLQDSAVKGKPVIVWGMSLGSAFATMVANERQDKIQGLILEGAFSSFPDIAKNYAQVLGVQNFKWIIPLVMNNDFPADEEIKSIHKPVVIIHSTEDNAVPYELGRKLYNSSNKETTKFWKVKGSHVQAIKLYEKQYVQLFLDMVNI